MEGVGLLGAGAAVGSLVNDTGRFNPRIALYEGECAVVRRYYILAGFCLGHNASPCGSDSRIYHGDKYGSLRPVAYGLNQPVAGLPGVVGFNPMGQIINLQVRRYAVGNSVHGADCAVLGAEICLEY